MPALRRSEGTIRFRLLNGRTVFRLVSRRPQKRTAHVHPGVPHTLTGDIRPHRGIHSEILGIARDVLVYLPPVYDADPSRRFPVLYANDGQNVFDGATSFVPGQEWQLDESAERLIRQGEVEPLIIVAVDHAGPRRLDEFGPSRDARRQAGGRADAYGRMLAEELKPFIDRTYRTRPEPDDTGLLGSSMGALVSLYLGLTRPDVFRRIGALSPAVWWSGRMIVRQVLKPGLRPPLRIWLDMGSAEGRYAFRDARALRDALLSKGFVEGESLAYHEVRGGEHTEQAWAARVPSVLKYLFPR